MTERGRKMMLKHVMDLSDLLKRMTPGTDAYKRIEARLEEAKEGARS